MLRSNNSNSLEFYRTEKERLLAAYSKLPDIGHDMLKKIERDQAWIDQSVAELESNRFKLFIAGQMNCGKSTLANALIFNRLVLPVYDSVMTSSITLIEHVSQHPSGIEGAKVEFYSEEEWQLACKGPEEHEKQKTHQAALQNTLLLARERGAIFSEWIGASPKMLEGFDDLPQYVTPVTKFRQGVFTPFVKSVTLYANSDLLQDMVVVDTPGTNDPNEQRARLTEAWIRQADAVVFVSYAGQALPSEDFNFINRFMLHVPSTHRIIAVNKIDTVENEDDLHSYLQSLRNDNREAIRQVFSTDTPTVCVCAIGGLIADYQGDLPAELKDERDERFEPEGYLLPERHRMQELRAVIEDRLVKNKGEYLLNSHFQKIDSTFKLAINSIESDISYIEARRLERSRGIEEIKKRKCDINSEITKVRLLFREFKDETEHLTTGELLSQEKIKSMIREITNNRNKEIKNHLDSCTSISQIKNQSDWIQREAVEKAVSEFGKFAKKSTETIKDEINRKINTIRSNLGKTDEFLSGNTSHIINKSLLIYLTELTPNDYISASEFSKLIDKAQNFTYKLINEIFNADWGKDRISSGISKVLRDSVINCLEEKSKFLKQSIVDPAVQEFGKSVEEEINKLLDKCGEDLDALIVEDSELEDFETKDKNEIAILKTEFLRIGNLQKTFE